MKTPLRKSAGLGLEGTRTCSSDVCKFRSSRFMQRVDAVAAEGGSRRGLWPVGTHSSNVSGLTATSQTPTQIFSRHISAHVCMCVCAYDVCLSHFCDVRMHTCGVCVSHLHDVRVYIRESCAYVKALPAPGGLQASTRHPGPDQRAQSRPPAPPGSASLGGQSCG